MNVQAAEAGKDEAGQIVGIRGGVVDVKFPRTSPRIHDLIYAGSLALEVTSLLDNGAVRCMALAPVRGLGLGMPVKATGAPIQVPRSEEHTSELQSRPHLVCRLLLEKKK